MKGDALDPKGLIYEAYRIEGITAAVEEMLRNHPEIDISQTMMVNFTTYASSSLDFFIYTFTKTTDWAQFHKVKQDVLLRVNTIIADHGAEPCAVGLRLRGVWCDLTEAGVEHFARALHRRLAHVLGAAQVNCDIAGLSR